MKIDRRSLLLGFAGFSSLGAVGAVACARHATPTTNRQLVLTDLTTKIIVPGYEEASTKVAALVTAMDALSAAPDASTLEAARAAWKTAHGAWKKTDAYLIGPADDLALTGGAIDGGPPAVDKLEAMMTATTPIEVGKLGGNQRGFAGLEWALFDPSGADLAAAFVATERRRTYVGLAARELQTKVDAVRDAWKNNYASSLSQAGRGSTVYATERQGMDAVVNAFIAASEVLIALRLAKPLGLDKNPPTPDAALVESTRANTSLDDIVAVLDGIEEAYSCTRNGLRGTSISDAVRDYAPEADDAVRRDIASARAAVKAVPPPLATAVVAARDAATAAHAACREVKRRFATEVAGTLGTSVGFNVTDGD